MTRPLVGIPASTGTQYGQPAQLALDQYFRAVADAGGVPVMIPAARIGAQPAEVLAHMDGILVPGDRSNIDPGLYGGPAPPPDEIHDPDRDDTTLRLIPAAIEAGLPVLAICRGLQEMNVALGGTLHARVHLADGMFDHRAPPEWPSERRFAPAHEIALEPDGLLQSLASADTATVNSLHGQGIEHLAPGLVVEARAPDGLIEAVRMPDARAFALGVQWHPEWRMGETPFHAAIFRAFIESMTPGARIQNAESRG